MINYNLKEIKTQLNDQCNAQFDTVGDQLVVKAKRPFHEANDQKEILMNYGRLQDYWIPF